MTTQAYPLAWPHGWQRTAPGKRQPARFSGTKQQYGSKGQPTWRSRRDLTVSEALSRLQREVEALHATYITLSTNLVLRLDGSPRSGQSEPNDPGAALYFTRAGRQYVLACDRWTRAADNIAAIAAHIGALRGQERWGVGSDRQAFAGYEALPPPDPSRPAAPPLEPRRQWYEMLGVAPTAPLAVCEAAYRALARTAHPDAGGSVDAMRALNEAIRAARARA